MSKRKRRGSSTRKYKQTVSQIVTKNPPAKKTDPNTAMLSKLTNKLKSCIGTKGKPLTDDEISKTKTRIATIEQLLNITHD